MSTHPATQQDLGTQNADLAELDPEVADRIDRELGRQREGLEMIASENHTAVLAGLRARVQKLAADHPLYPGLAPLGEG